MNVTSKLFLALLSSLAFLMSSTYVCSTYAGEDWPMWRYDATRSAASVNSLPDELQLLWQRKFAPRQQAWDDPLNLDLMSYDRLFEPIVLDGRVVLNFNDSDKVLALDAATGKDLWSSFAEAPVRLPAVGADGRVYFCSDDGVLYCVSARDGSLIWKFSGAPSAHHAIGNRRLTSAWPARGAPVLRDGRIYFAASIWPFMGTFLYAVNAETGRVEWVNDSTGAQYIRQPHSAPSFAGVAPQGALVATDRDLIVPGGRSVPAVFERSNGNLRYFEINAAGKGTGGSFVIANDKQYYVHTRGKGTRAFDLASGLKTAFMPNEPVLSGNVVYTAEMIGEQSYIRAYSSDQTKHDWQIAADGSGDLILAGDKLVAAGKNAITIIRLPTNDKEAEVVLSIPTEQTVERLLVANHTLFGVTLDGQILAWGTTGARRAERTLDLVAVAENSATKNPFFTQDPAAQVAASLLSASNAEGFAFWFGDSRSQVLDAIAAKSPFTQLAVVHDDAPAVDELRRRLDAAGLYGRVTAHRASAPAFRAPMYVANMIFVAEDIASSADAGELTKIYESVRPYGGVMHLLAGGDRDQLAARVRAMQLEQAEVEVLEHSVVVRRVGKLPGAADWTHQYGDVANTIKSNDSRVKLPLGVLWFGGSSNEDVLPRHGHGPPEQVVGGRLFIQGMNCLSARDVYTGRVLWKREFEDLGTFDIFFDSTYDDTPLDPKYNQVHIPGANGRGTNYVVTEDRVYLLVKNACLVLDPATGATITEMRMPRDEKGDEPEWGYIGVYKDVLIGGQGFAKYRERLELGTEADKNLTAAKAGFGMKSLDRAASVGLIAFDRLSGQKLWSVPAKHSFWHNGIVAGGDRIYCLDKNPSHVEQAMLRRGKAPPDSYRIVALDYRTGEAAWSVSEGIFGTWLGYSEQHDLLLQAGAQASDRLSTETGKGMTVYRGRDGKVEWQNDKLAYAGPCILHNDLIITNANAYIESSGAYYLKTGLQKMVKNPLTGEVQPWKLTRAYGCNNIIASENMLTFRSGAAGFYDLLSEAGTGNLGGFKSGCTSNLVVANGVLNAPDYTRTCSCGYQNQTSLALVHMPDIDVWSTDGIAAKASSEQEIRSLGINLGAPGDRRDAEGQLWLEHPSVGGDSAALSVKANPEATFFQHHSSSLAAFDKPWILASGIENVSVLQIGLQLDSPFNLKNGLPVAHAHDDAEESSKGEVSLTSSDLELVEDADGQVVGLRFNKLNLARNATIRGAYIQFTCDEPSKGATELSIAIEDTASAAPFLTEAHSISSRILRADKVKWKPVAWEKAADATAAQRSPDVAALLQGIVSRPDWKPGNSVVFVITGKGKRIATASKGAAVTAPRLVVDADVVDPSELAAEVPSKSYDLKLYFGCPASLHGGTRVFDVYLQDKLALENVTLSSDGPAEQQHAVYDLKNVSAGRGLRLRFVPKQGKPLLSGIEVKQRDVTP